MNFPIKTDLVPIPDFSCRPILFVYSGVVHKLKGIWEMLVIIKQLNLLNIDCKIHIIGEIRPSELKQEIITYVLENGLLDHVFLAPRRRR